MIKNVYNKISLRTGVASIFYSARLFASEEEALHACIKDIYYNQFAVVKVSVFEGPLRAYVDVKPNKGNLPPPSLLQRLKFLLTRHERLESHKQQLKLDVIYRPNGTNGFKVVVQLLEPPVTEANYTDQLLTA